MSDDPVDKFKALKAELRRDGITPELWDRARDATRRVHMQDLIERSSLGTPGAKAIRARTPPEVVDEVLRRVTESTVERHHYQEAGGQTPGECRLCGNVPTATCHQVLG